MAQDDPSNDIRLKPGRLVATPPPHLVGLRGSTPYATGNRIPVGSEPTGFKNLVTLNGETAVPFMQASSGGIQDGINGGGTLWLGGQVLNPGVTDTVDVTTQFQMPSRMFFAQRDDSFVPMVPVFNSEGIQAQTTGLRYGAYYEEFTKSGTGVTVTAGSNLFAGQGGTTWTTDQLAGAYLPAANIAINSVQPGDLIGVNNAGGTARNWYRILQVNANNQLTVFPTPQAGNDSIGVNRDYRIIRTGYGGYGRGIPFTDSSGVITWYYAGTSHNVLGSGQSGHGTIQAIQFVAAPSHYMGPETVDTLGVTTGFPPKADDIAFYKGFLLYGADTAVSWSVAGFPTGGFGAPFSTTDFPAANITVVDATSKFVTFEYLGDQLLAIFEESIWLISATGSIPEFAFYRLPETLSIISVGQFEPCGITTGLMFGRPSCTARGAVFYLSDRGIEQLSGGLSEEASAPIAPILLPILNESGTYLSTNMVHLSWSDDFDLLWVRQAYSQSGRNMVYNPATKDWSEVVVMPRNGSQVLAVEASVPSSTRRADCIRRWHIGYYEPLEAGGTIVTDGGNTVIVAGSPDTEAFFADLPAKQAWTWRTVIVPAGLRYPDFSFGGFLLDAILSNTAGQTITWKLYGGASPYQMVQRDSGTITSPTMGAAGGQTPWTSSRVRLAKKTDDPFLMLEFTSFFYAEIAGVILFNANTQVVR